MPDNNKVKISVDAEEKTNKKSVAKTSAKTKPAASGSKNGSNNPGAKKGKSSGNRGGGGIVQLFLAILITALIIGGAVYAWQKSTKQELANQLGQEAKETRMNFEKRIDNLKNTITDIESEKETIKQTAEELKKQARLLLGAKKEYGAESLGVSFEYPALLGEVVITEETGATGTVMAGSFDESEKVRFGGASAGFAANDAATGTAQSFTRTLGFEERGDGYYFLTPKGAFKVEPMEVFELANGEEALLLDKNSFTATIEGDVSPVDIGGNLGAVVNLSNGVYPGVGFLNTDFGVMPLEDFKKMISSINTL
jgi:cell division protein FtsB